MNSHSKFATGVPPKGETFTVPAGSAITNEELLVLTEEDVKSSSAELPTSTGLKVPSPIFAAFAADPVVEKNSQAQKLGVSVIAEAVAS